MLNKQGITISLCMIVRDEEETIARCLETVEKIVDEIIVVDTGSVDRTKEIVEKYTSNIYDFQWIDDFAAARNFSFSKATQEYILWLDADDVLLEDAQEALKLGLVNEVLPPDKLIPYAREQALKLIPPKGASMSIKLMKKTMHNYFRDIISKTLDLENEGYQKLIKTRDFRESTKSLKDSHN